MKYYKKWIGLAVLTLALMIITIFFVCKTSEAGSLDTYFRINMEDQVQSVIYDRESELLFLGSYQNRIIALNTAGEALWSFPTGNVVTDFVLGADDSIFASSDDGHIYRLEKQSGKLIQDILIQRRVYDIDLDEDNDRILVSAGTGSTKHLIMMYTLDGELVWKYPVPSICRKAAFSRDHKKIYFGTERADLFVLDSDGKEIQRERLRSSIKGIAVSGITDEIAVVTDYGTLYKFNEDDEIIFSKMYEFQDNVTGFSADESLEHMAIGGRFGEIYVIDSKGTILYKEDRDQGISSFEFTDTQLIIGSLGEPVFLLPLTLFDSSRLVSSINSILRVSLFVLAFFFIICVICSLSKTRAAVLLFWNTLKKYRTAYLLLLPTFLMLIIFMYYPMVIAFIRGFTDWNVRSEEIHFIGFENFKRMVTEGYFLLGLKNLFFLSIADMIKVLTIPMIVAELVFAMKISKFRYWFRFFFVLPMVVPMIVTVLMWKNIYDPSIGMLNNLLASMNLDKLQRVWLGDPNTALGSIIGMGFPFIDGFAFLVYYGGLINIPTQLFEAAKVDGAGRMWNFTHIHLPLLTPQFKMLIILKFIGSIQNFMPIYILTGGGPGVDTYVPGLELYYHATTFGNYGYACALGMALFVFILIGTIFNMRMRVQSQA